MNEASSGRGPSSQGNPPPAGRTSPRLDRVGRPRASAHERVRDGKEALYSTAPSARPTAPVEVRCERCDARLELGVLDGMRLLRPPWVLNPWSRRLWTRCPACSQRAWLQVTPGPTLRMLWERPPSG